jgi:hypothetical protein
VFYGTNYRTTYAFEVTIKNQAATSFHVNCDSAYTIRFNSMNLRSMDGSSLCPYKLRTRLTVAGPVDNLWNVPLTANTHKDNKYIISVRLEDRPSIQVPAGTYRDMVYVNLSF